MHKASAIFSQTFGSELCGRSSMQNGKSKNSSVNGAQPISFGILGDTEDVTRAIRRGVREALLDHKRKGQPIAEWKDGKAVWTPADQIEVPPEEESGNH